MCWGERCHKGSPCWFHLKSPLHQTQNSCKLNLPMCTLASPPGSARARAQARVPAAAAAAAAARGTGAFCLERLRGGPGAAKPAAFPSSLGPGTPSPGVGRPPLGRASPQAPPPRPRPAPPGLRGGTGWAFPRGPGSSRVAGATCVLRARTCPWFLPQTP